MELSHVDSLRLNVLVSECEAIRIDESAMTVHGLSGDREHTVRLTASRSPDLYLRAVRELLSSQVIQSPGGYPVFLNRWTRTGQLDNLRLASLLKLGEPEAVTAVASSSGLDAELARLAWWARPVPETARFLLEHEDVQKNALAKHLADHLLEYLPFETEPIDIVNSVRLLLGVDGLPDEVVEALWRRGSRKTSILLGFVKARPFALPQSQDALDDTGHPCADSMEVLLSRKARILYETLDAILTRPDNQDIVVECLETLSRVLAPARPAGEDCDTIDAIERRVAETESTAERTAKDDASRHRRAVRFLSLVGEPLVRHYFSRSTTVGALMRKQLAPIIDPVCRELRTAARAGRT